MVLEFIRGKYGLQLLMFLLIAFLSWILFQILGMVVLFGFTDLNLQDLAGGDLMAGLKNRKDGYFILYTLLITQSIGLFVIPSLVYARLVKDKNQPFLTLSTDNLRPFLALLPVFVIAGIVLVGFMGELNMKLNLPQFFHDMETQATETITYIMSFRSTPHLIATAILLSVVPAIGEELFFRGIIQKTLVNWTQSNWQAILITAFIFSAIHFQFLTFLPRFFMGIMLGYLLVWSRSLWIPILAHFLHNFLSIAIGIQQTNLEPMPEESLSIWLVFGSALVFVAIGYWYYISYKKHHVSENPRDFIEEN